MLTEKEENKLEFINQSLTFLAESQSILKTETHNIQNI